MLTTNSMGGNIVSAIVIFTLIFYTRFQLLDNQYKYSFEPDSEACVSVTKSFYNFFKNPCKETIPNTLSSYPPYQDGDFIFGAITANCIRILVNIGCLETNVGDGDNSIIICAMRWNGVFFQCLAGVLVFMIVLILTDCTLASALITVIYFILSPQLLDIDLIRIDYFYFFSAVVLFYASLRLVVQPNKGINYTLAGISTALVVSTKMNFPFYLLPVIASFIYLFIHKKVSTKYVFVFFISFVISFIFLFQRWLFYPEEILHTVSGILTIGDEWVSFWGIKPYSFYHYNQFFSNGNSWEINLLIVGWVLSFLITIVSAIKKENSLILTFLLVFIIQSIILVMVPKIGRYGTIIPVWICFFLGVSFKWAITKTPSYIFYVVLLFFLIPNLSYSKEYFDNHVKRREKVSQSVQQTRLDAYTWIQDNVEPGSVVAVYHPRISNPPIFELPLKITEKYLKFPFLDKHQLVKFHPPTTQTLKENANYVILNNEYFNYHLNLLNNLAANKEQDADQTLARWNSFYDSLGNLFDLKKFESHYINYGINWFKIYIIDSVPKYPHIDFLKLHSTSINNEIIEINFSLPQKPQFPTSFEFQISSDSSFRWIDYGSYDGQFSKYREHLVSYPDVIPKKILSMINSGELSIKTGLDLIKHKHDLNRLFFKILDRYTSGNFNTLDLCLADIFNNEDRFFFYSLLNSVYDTTEHAPEYSLDSFLEVTELNLDSLMKLKVTFKIPLTLLPSFKNEKKYYFRVRRKEEHWIFSKWLDVGLIKKKTAGCN